MLLTRVLNACHHFPGFVYEGATLDEVTRTIEVHIRPRRGSKPRCSGCSRSAACYDRLPARRFEFIPMWGFTVRFVTVHHAAGPVWRLRGEGRASAVGHRPAHPKERTTESFEQFFTMIGKEVAEQIEFVCSDMWKPYLSLIAEHCTNALNILDRFHVVAKMNLALDDVRAAEARRLVQDGYEPVLKKSRWCLLKRPANLTDNQRVKLRDVPPDNLASVRAYLLKEAFQDFWTYDSPSWAGKFLDEWTSQVMRSRIGPMKKFARTMRTHRELSLNYFRARKAFSSGVLEGLNNEVKVTMRKAYGFRTFEITEIALDHALGKLPEPTLAHRFY